MQRVLDVTINVAVLVLAGVAVWTTFGRSGEPLAPQGERALPPVIAPGEFAGTLPGLDYSAASKTLVVVVRSDCSYCIESGDFYRTILNERHTVRSDVQIVVAAPSTDSGADDYVRTHGLNGVSLIRLTPGVLKVRATPTLLLIGSDGVVQSVWEGRLTPSGERAVLASLSPL